MCRFYSNIMARRNSFDFEKNMRKTGESNLLLKQKVQIPCKSTQIT